MAHVLESAPSGRSKCRGCGQAIGKGELRFGERLPNPFGDGEMTLWFHPACAAWRRPEPLLETLAGMAPQPAGSEAWRQAAQLATAHRRLPRIDGAERATSGRAACRQCQEPIGRGEWRVRLMFFEEGRFQPGGFVHVSCARAYFECDDLLDAVLQFSPGLDEVERGQLRVSLAGTSPGEAP